MFKNMTNIPEMEVLAALAEGYFGAKCPKYTDNNYNRYVLVNVDTHKCSFKHADYSVELGEALFKCEKKDGKINVLAYHYFLDDEKPKYKITNYDGELITSMDGNNKNIDTGLIGKYVVDDLDLEWYGNEVMRGRIINLDELIETGFYNEDLVRDAYQAIGDFSTIINNIEHRYYPIYIQVPFCENTSYLFKYINFSVVRDCKACINYQFLGITTNDVTIDELEKVCYTRKSDFGRVEYPVFLMPYEIHSLIDALDTSDEWFEKVFNQEDYERYEIKKSYIMNRFYPKTVLETKYGIFHVVYDRPSDLANLYYSKGGDVPVERVPGHGDFGGTWLLVRDMLKKLHEEISIEVSPSC